MNDESQLALTRFDFRNGALRGSQLILYPRCLVHRSDAELETVPLARVTAIKVSFKREPRRLGWGIACLIAALLLLAVASPLGSFAHTSAQEMAANPQGVARALYGLLRFTEVLAALLPAIALGGVIGGAYLAVLGWRGSTTMTLSLGGSERAYGARGRDPRLLDFAEMAAERLMTSAR
ncbi:MAG: hypothetical protein JO292_06445 [Betaproteobacteria bacterium]|nr:hypothetical protein [Betaproteobacteria bacterium]MBV9361014.1 hypothetical protein [Betaproteobacteria bacterium]